MRIPVDLRDADIHAKIVGRRIALLDTNVWIDLSEARTEGTSRLQNKLREHVRSSRLICPLTYSTISETYFQTYPSALRTATLMEELSLNTSFASREQMFAREVDVAIATICDERYYGAPPFAEIFVPFIGFLSADSTLTVPDRLPPEVRRRLLMHLDHGVCGIGFADFVRMIKDSLPMAHSEAPAYAAAAMGRKEIARGSKERARRMEEESVLKNVIRPRLMELPVGRKLQLLRRLPELPKDRYGGISEHLLQFMPAIAHYISVMTAVGYDAGRRDRMTDFFDLELITAPFVYSDVIVTQDKRIPHILSSASEFTVGVPQKKQCLPTIAAFEDYLDGLKSVASLDPLPTLGEEGDRPPPS